MSIIIVDLDGCVSDDKWRRGYLRPPFYEDYHMLAPWDEPQNLDIFAGGHAVAIFTARPSAYRLPTKEWLARRGIKWQWLFMRGLGNVDPSPLLKQKMFVSFARNRRISDIVAIYDDRADVLDALRQYGVPCYQRDCNEKR